MAIRRKQVEDPPVGWCTSSSSSRQLRLSIQVTSPGPVGDPTPTKLGNGRSPVTSDSRSIGSETRLARGWPSIHRSAMPVMSIP